MVMECAQEDNAINITEVQTSFPGLETGDVYWADAGHFAWERRRKAFPVMKKEGWP